MTITTTLVSMLVLGAAACDDGGRDSVDVVSPSDPTVVDTATPTATERSTTEPTVTESGSTTSVSTPTPAPVTPLYEAGDIDRGLQFFIDQAAAALAEHLGVEVTAISTHAAVLVVWPDSSLGCPVPDMSYAQVLTDGSIIELDHDGDIYRYHTGGSRGPFICEQPITKTPPSELLTLEDFDD